MFNNNKKWKKQNKWCNGSHNNFEKTMSSGISSKSAELLSAFCRHSNNFVAAIHTCTLQYKDNLLKIKSFGKNDSAGTRETLGGHLHFFWDTSESLVFHFSYTWHSIVPLSFTCLSLVGHLVSKVSSECFITDLLGLGSQLLQSTRQFFGFQPRLYLFLSALCH